MTFPIRRAWGPAAALIACALTLSACGDEDAANNSPTFVNTEARGTADPLYGKETTTAAPAASSAAPSGDVQAVLDRIVAEHGDVGIAVSDGTTTIEAGRTAPEAAWSTSKVPVRFAAISTGQPDQHGETPSLLKIQGKNGLSFKRYLDKYSINHKKDAYVQKIVRKHLFCGL